MSSPEPGGFRQQIALMGLEKPDGFNPYAAGAKVYGYGSNAATKGPVDPTGYKQRDMIVQVKKNALQARMRATMNGNYMSPGYLRGE